MEEYLKISLFLHKDVSDFQECIKESALDKVTQYKIDSEKIGLDGYIYIHEKTKNFPPWKGQLEKIAEDGNIKIEENVSNKAVVVVKYEENYFSLTYGRGKSIIDDDKIVKNFGLKVSANLIEPNRIKSLNSFSIGEAIILNNKQASILSSQDQMQVDKEKEILKSIAGSPKDDSIAKFLYGSDSLNITVNYDITGLKNLIEGYYNAYNKEYYKDNGFEWIDNIKNVKNKKTKNILNQQLVKAIVLGEFDNIVVSPNEIIDWGDAEKYIVNGIGEDNEFSIHDTKFSKYFRYIKEDFDETIDTVDTINYDKIINKLKRNKIKIKYISSEEKQDIANIYKCLVFETIIEDKKFILCFGDWYEVNEIYYDNIKEKISKISISSIELPPFKSGEKEEIYNERVSNQNPEYILMDQKNYQPKEYGKSKIEICDIFTSDNELVHVKIARGSSSFSHLFAQGLVSAKLLANDNNVINFINESINEKNTFNILNKDKSNEEFEIVYAIIDNRDKRMDEIIPFFSMINLVQVTENLSSMGYKFSITRIPVN